MRYATWSTKMANPEIVSVPKLNKTRRPTSHACVELVKRAYYQTMIIIYIRCVTCTSDPLAYGWVTKEDNKLFSVLLSNDVSADPLKVLQMIYCGCTSTRLCFTGRCSCVVAKMSCSIFCTCHAGVECNNVYTKTTLSHDYQDMKNYEGLF